MKIIACLLITKGFSDSKALDQQLNDLATYIYHIDKLIVFNMSKTDLSPLYEKLKRYKKAEYADCDNYGEVNNYRLALNQALAEEADYAVIMEPGYFYEEDAFLKLKRFLMEEEIKPAVLTPLPLFTCTDKKQTKEIWREILGAHLLGALLDTRTYRESPGFIEDYYQTTFDYDYCLSVRQKGKKVVLLNNAILRSRHYTVVEKRDFLIKRSGFERDLVELYYETRNRLYLWEKYKSIDPKYVKLDKALARAEKKEIKYTDKSYRDKLIIIEKANADYKKGLKGKCEIF